MQRPPGADDLIRASLGHPWGGVLGAERAVRRPAGLEGPVLADVPAAMRLWIGEADRLRRALPPQILDVLVSPERDGSLGPSEHHGAVQV